MSDFFLLFAIFHLVWCVCSLADRYMSLTHFKDQE